jgi:hypothetical protein
MIDRVGHVIAGWILQQNAWTAVLLAVALMVDRALARRVRASTRIALYAPVALRIVLPLSWRVTLAHAPAFLLAGDAIAAAPAAGEAGGRLPWPALAAAAYVAGAALLAVRAWRRRAVLADALRGAVPLRGFSAEWPVVRHPELGPMVVGVARPRVVVPEGLLCEEREEALHFAMRHELAHLRRRDPWLSAAIEALVVLAWPVVPVWIAAARVRQLVEQACDEQALAGADVTERRRYGHALLDLAEQGVLGAGELHFGSNLRARVEALAAAARRWPRGLQVALVASIVAVLAACSSAGPGPAESRDPGHIPPDVIQSIVRSQFGAYRDCFEAGLVRDNALKGTARVSFTIERDGSVSHASGEGSTLADPEVVRCVVDGVGKLRFPAPDDGTVTVIYPIQFSPDPIN